MIMIVIRSDCLFMWVQESPSDSDIDMWFVRRPDPALIDARNLAVLTYADLEELSAP